MFGFDFIKRSLFLKDCLGFEKVDRLYYADNVAITAGLGTSIASDDIGDVHYQRIKIVEGADGVNDGDISSANGLPVELLASSAAIGKLAANSGVDIGDVTLTAGSASIGTLGANSGVDIGDVTINNASGASAVNIQDGGNSITVDGTITANLSATDNQVLDDIAASLAVLDDWDSGDTAKVTLQAGSASIGILGANSGVDIGDVTINNASGASAVNIQDGGNAITVDNGGTFVVQENGDALTALQLIDDVVFADNGISSSEKGILSVWLDDLHTLRAVQKGRPLPVMGGIHGNVTISGITTISGGMHPSTYAIDGSPMPSTPALFPIGGEYRASLTTYNDGDATVIATDIRGITLTKEAYLHPGEDDTNNLLKIAGNIDHDSPDASGAPVKIGGYASATAPSNVGSADRVNAWFLLNGSQAATITAAGALIGGDASNGLDVDVTRMAALVAGSASIGVLGANSGVDIGDVTINNPSGASAVNIQDGGNSITVDNEFFEQMGGDLSTISETAHNEDQPSSHADVGMAVMGVRKQTPLNTSDTDGDYEFLQMHLGRLLTNAVTAKSFEYLIASGNIPLQKFRQPVNVNANGQILVSGVTNRKIAIINGVLMAKTAVDINLKSNNNTDVTGPLFPAANGGFQIPHADLGNFETRTGENLTIALSSGVQVGGWLTYVLV